MKKLTSQARVTEVDDTADRIIVKHNDDKKVADDAVISAIVKEITHYSDLVTEALKRGKLFSELEAADNVRDTKGRLLFDGVTGYAALPIPALSEPAKRILKILEKYGLGIFRENYAQESSHMEAMLLDLEAPAVAEDAKLLQGVPELIAAVGEAQTEFTKKRVAYEQAYAANENLPTATELKKPLLELINNKLIPYLEVMKGINAEKYGLFTDSVEKIIADTNDTVNRRSGSADAKTKQ